MSENQENPFSLVSGDGSLDKRLTELVTELDNELTNLNNLDLSVLKFINKLTNDEWDDFTESLEADYDNLSNQQKVLFLTIKQSATEKNQLAQVQNLSQYIRSIKEIWDKKNTIFKKMKDHQTNH